MSKIPEKEIFVGYDPTHFMSEADIPNAPVGWIGPGSSKAPEKAMCYRQTFIVQDNKEGENVIANLTKAVETLRAKPSLKLPYKEDPYPSLTIEKVQLFTEIKTLKKNIAELIFDRKSGLELLRTIPEEYLYDVSTAVKYTGEIKITLSYAVRDNDYFDNVIKNIFN